jgi:hypothetical protein
MLYIITKRFSSQKPPIGSQINWGHPLAQNLEGCWLINENTGLISPDIASISHGVSYGAPTRAREGITLNGSTQYIDMGINPRHDFFTLGTDFSITMILKEVSVMSSCRFISRLSATASRGWFVVNFDYWISYTFVVQLSATQESYRPTTSVYISSTKSTYTFTCNKSAAAGSKGAIYYNGKNVPVSYDSNPGFGWGTTQNLNVGRRTSNQSYANIEVYAVYLHSRKLSPDDARKLYYEPYCFIQPRKIWVPTAGGVLGPGSGKRRLQLVG